MSQLIVLDFSGGVRGVEHTPGGLVVRARVSKVGIFTYLEGGVALRVLRAPADLFAPESLATLANCPVTIDHPASREVTPENYGEVTMGHVDGAIAVVDATYLETKLVIDDAAAASLVASKRCVECSGGYRAEYAKNADGSYESGMWNGQPYDRRQVTIRWNHVALGPRGWARLGRDCAIQLDARDVDRVADAQRARDVANLAAYYGIEPRDAEALAAHTRK